MSTEISKNLRCVVVRGGIELWIDESKIDLLKSIIEKNSIVNIEGNVINTKDIVGIFTPEVMKERDIRKRGDWECGYGKNHQKYEICKCLNSKGYRN